MKKCIAFLFALILGVNGYAQRYLGGDISLLPAYKANGTVYKNKDGLAACPYEIFKESGWNAMRVRLFVNPDNAPQANKDEGVCQDLDYVVGLCKQIKNHGFKLMLDFHYSDTWADPGKQFMPATWADAVKDKIVKSRYAYWQIRFTATPSTALRLWSQRAQSLISSRWATKSRSAPYGLRARSTR